VRRILIDIPEAAEHLRVCTKTVRRFISDGKLTGYRVGRLIRVDLAEVDALAAPIPTIGRAR
jgi:excisionase family DNA binding protein